MKIKAQTHISAKPRTRAERLQPPSQARLREVLDYDPDSGEFRWRHAIMGGVEKGDIAGTIMGRGYRLIGLDGARHYAHRLAWIYMTGSVPQGIIDHRDRCKSNNAWANLRDANAELNTRNVKQARSTNHLGLLGVSRVGNRFRAEIHAGKFRKHLGCFSTPEEAHCAYLKAKETFHPGALHD